MMRRVMSAAVPLVWCLATWLPQSAWAQPTVQQALKLAPVQPQIDYDRPSEEDSQRCTIQAETADGQTAWVVRADGGNLLLNVGPRADGSIPEVQSKALPDFARLT